MTGKALHKAVQKLGAGTASGDRITVADGSTVTLHVSVGQSSMTLQRVTEIEIDGELALITAARGSRFAVHCDDIGAIECSNGGSKKTGYQ